MHNMEKIRKKISAEEKSESSLSSKSEEVIAKKVKLEAEDNDTSKEISQPKPKRAKIESKDSME